MEIFQNIFIVMKCTVDNDYVNGSTQYHCSALSERLQKKTLVLIIEQTYSKHIKVETGNLNLRKAFLR